MADYEQGTKIEVPGLEATIEYGDASTISYDRIPGAYLINDRSRPDLIRLESISGLQDDPDQRDTRNPNSDRHGESAGIMLYGGRTIGLTGQAEAGNIPRVRQEWRRFRDQFGAGQQDLLLHSPFEVPAYVNEVRNPDLIQDGSYWASFAGFTPPVIVGGVADGDMLVGKATWGLTFLDGTESTFYPSLVEDATASNTGNILPWVGQDAYVGALVKVHSATATVSSISVALQTATTDDVDAQALPATGTWYWLGGRVLAGDMPETTVDLSMAIKVEAGEGDYELHFTRVTLVSLRTDDPTPKGYIGASLPGFEPMGVLHRSRSIGPAYAVNAVNDREFLVVDDQAFLPPGMLKTWEDGSSASVGVGYGLPSPRLRPLDGATLGRSCYYYATKDASGTARRIAMRSINLADPAGSSRYVVSGGRTYRWSGVLKRLQGPTNEAVCLFIQWYSPDGSGISSDASAAATGTAQRLQAEAVAPENATRADLFVGVITTSQSSANVEFIFQDPSYVDITDFDPGLVLGDEPIGEGVELRSPVSIDGVIEEISTGFVRRIPRPYLIEQVRKASIASPEQQPDHKYARPFTMSLRASNPRIYMLDERHNQLHLEGDSKLVIRQSPDDFTLETADLPLPDGYTYEGHYITDSGSGSPYYWTRESWNYRASSRVPALHPNFGVGFKAWDSLGVNGANRPTSDLKARVYRSDEGFTYDNPRVIVGGAPSGFGTFAPTTTDWGRMNAQVSGSTFYANHLAAIVKRVNSGSWLEMRWNSISHAAGSGVYNLGTAPYAFELWSSHADDGTPGTTKLSSWDYESYDSSSGFYPFRASTDPMWLVSWILADVLYWELWSTYPSPIDTSGRIESGSYELSPDLITLIGSGVAGHTGWSMCVPKAFDQGSFDALVDEPPFLHYFESSKADVPAVTMSMAVIGSIDTPQVLQLRGDIVDPIVTISVPAYEDKPAWTSIARFTGTMLESDPISISLSPETTITNSTGADRYDLALPGSDFAMLRPGANSITIQAKSWGEYAAHAVVSWRDALR